ncbi:3-beta-hydroxysteroid-delta -isomerase [Colletotrichum musicola]|uniref:3-beta-hydroxysteroid-delta -isomerase n=1 Tax=Colletotrichum musicola TaxID=2175873 RepID=A0A8H6JQE1_9PEZI|nr:3-beta-hydroxysteroid-delta -isomerase [Colletotrichum musicola]
MAEIINATMPLHPYYPLDGDFPGLVLNSRGTLALVSSFGAGTVAILLPAFHLIRRHRPSISNGEMATALWFVLCGFIHFFFEGYFAYNQHRMPTMTDIFGELWKEYSKSDSRYLTQDSFLVPMETVTAFLWGPMSFACAWCIAAGHPAQHALQIIISLGQLYGDVLYFATCEFNVAVRRIVYCRPEDYYFYFYYVMMNAFWIVIPFFLVVKGSVATTRAFARVAELERAPKKNL